jgi:succinate dehydrogenase/fumarate reductase flavoprotein subunit
MADYDVVVVGAGNAALTAAVSAREHGAARVLVLEKAPRPLRGGNTQSGVRVGDTVKWSPGAVVRARPAGA